MNYLTTFYSKIKKTIDSYKMVSSGQTVLVGLSGGADSVTLFDVLNYFSKLYGFTVVAAHLNHCLRGEESDKDELLSVSLATKYDCNIITESIDVKKYAKDYKLGLEDAARTLRYDFFKRAATEVGATRIAVAHHKDDNVETFLMRIIRGSGVKGLSGIPYLRVLDQFLIVRPFLDVSRKEILKFVKEKDLLYREDTSNKDIDMTRNKVRNVLIPMLEKEYNPSLKKSISGEIAALSAVNDFVQFNAQSNFKNTVIEVSENEFNIVCKNIKKLAYALQLEIIRKILIKFSANVNRKHIIAVYDLVNKKGSGKKLVLEGGLIAVKVYDFVRISFQNIKDEKFDVTATVGSETVFGFWNWQASLELTKVGKINEAKKTLWGQWNKGKEVSLTALFDYDALKSDAITFRSRKAGDKYQPLGMPHNKKIKDIFIDAKVPVSWRDNIPVVLGGEQIILLAGYRVADFVKVNKNTVNVLKLTLKGMVS